MTKEECPKSEEEHTLEDARVNRQWKWRRRLAISAMLAILISGVYIFILLGAALIAPELLASAGAFFGWWFGTLVGIVMVYIGGATAADVAGFIKAR